MITPIQRKLVAILNLINATQIIYYFPKRDVIIVEDNIFNFFINKPNANQSLQNLIDFICLTMLWIKKFQTNLFRSCNILFTKLGDE